jgi:hypothetical protein
MKQNKKKTLIQQAEWVYIKEFVKEHPNIPPIENGSLAEQVAHEYQQRIQSGNLNDYCGTEKGNQFIVLLAVLMDLTDKE